MHQNTPFQVKNSFLWGVGIAPSSYPSCWKREPPSIAPNKPSVSRSTLRPPDFQPDLCLCTSPMFLPDFTGYQHPSLSLNQWSSSTEPSTTLLLGICLISSDTLLIYRRKDVSFQTSQRPPFTGGRTIISEFNQPSRPTQPPTLRRTGNEYRPEVRWFSAAGESRQDGSLHSWINVLVAGGKFVWSLVNTCHAWAL